MMEYKGIKSSTIQKTIAALEKRFSSNNTELTLKNGIQLLISRKPNGDVCIYDLEPNLIAEFDGEYNRDNAMFNAAVFLIEAAK